MQSIPASTCFFTVSAIAGVTSAAMAAGSVSSALASRAGMSSHPLGGGSRPTCEVLIRVVLCFMAASPSSPCEPADDNMTGVATASAAALAPEGD
jgi:hypothetical protein